MPQRTSYVFNESSLVTPSSGVTESLPSARFRAFGARDFDPPTLWGLLSVAVERAAALLVCELA